MMSDGKKLQNRVAIITGAASGIGQATALRFASEGAGLVLADISEGALSELAEEISSGGTEVFWKVTDVSSESDIKNLVKLALDSFSQIDIICNNAGITGDFNRAVPEDQDREDWLRVYSINVMGAVYMLKHVAAHMKERQYGAVVNTSSVAGIRSGAGPNAYSASKAALINFTRTTACDLGKYNIRVNCVCPGLIKTGMTKEVFDYAEAAGKTDKVGSRCELRRYGHPEEIANAILFLASDEASYITGQALAVDGGNTASLNLPGMKF